MKEIKQVIKDIEGNIHEAREKIHKAYELMDRDRMFADWQRDMALSHLNFNTRGHEIVKRMIADIIDDAHPLAAGMRAVYEDRHADIVREAAEVRSMIDNYGK
jgi:hypothetical protein